LLRVFAPENLSVSTEKLLTPEEKSASLNVCNLLQPGDIILTCTPGKAYETLRLLSNSAYDHVAVVLDSTHCLQVGPPAARLTLTYLFTAFKRKPCVLRPRLTRQSNEKFIEALSLLVGRPYDYTKTLKIWTKLFIHKFTGVVLANPQLKPSHRIICTEAVTESLPGGRAALQTFKQDLDFGKFKIPSVNDFLVLASHGIFDVVRLPFPYHPMEGAEDNILTYRLKVISHIRELHELVSTVRDGIDMRAKKYKKLYFLLWASAYALKSESLPSHQLFSLISRVWPKL